MHLLFFDLVALNYEPSTPVLTSIYDMKLLDKVLTDPAIALLFLDASKKGSCSIYLHDIHGYGPQIAYRFPIFNIFRWLFREETDSMCRISHHQTISHTFRYISKWSMFATHTLSTSLHRASVVLLYNQ